MANETATVLLEQLCGLLEAQLHIQAAIYAKTGIDFCVTPAQIHIYRGIDQAAEILGEETHDEERDDYFPLRRSFRHNGIEFFQLSNRDGSFQGIE